MKQNIDTPKIERFINFVESLGMGIIASLDRHSF